MIKAPPAGRASSRETPRRGLSPLQTQPPTPLGTHASHSSFSTVAKGLACKWRGHSWNRGGEELGEGCCGCCEPKRGVPEVGGGVEGGPARPNDLVQLDELRDGVPHLDGDLHHVPRGRHGRAGTWTWAWAPGAWGASQRTHLGQPGGSTAGPPASPGTALTAPLPGSHSHQPARRRAAPAFPKEPRPVPGWSQSGVGAGKALAPPRPPRPHPVPRCSRWRRSRRLRCCAASNPHSTV